MAPALATFRGFGAPSNGDAGTGVAGGNQLVRQSFTLGSEHEGGAVADGRVGERRGHAGTSATQGRGASSNRPVGTEDRSCRRPKRFPPVGSAHPGDRQTNAGPSASAARSRVRRSRDRRRARGRGLPRGTRRGRDGEVGLAEGRDHARDARARITRPSASLDRVAVDRHERRAFRVDEHVGGFPPASRPALTRSSPSQTKSPSR